MSKQTILQKQLVKTGLIATIGVAVLGAIVIAVYTWSSSLDEDLNRAQSQLSGTRNDTVTRQEKNEQAHKYLDVYKKISGKNQDSRLAGLNREIAQTWIAKAAQHYGLVSLDGSFEPVAELSRPEFKKTTLQGISSKVQLKVGALSDEDIFRFMESLLTDFPGYVKIENVLISKKADITPEVLTAISAGDIKPIVEATIDFQWLGVREIKKKDSPPVEGGAQ